MAHHKHSAVIVFNQATNEHGIITERDLLKILARGESHTEHLWKYAAHPLITINSEETLLQGLLTLQQYRIRHLGVTDKDGNVIGLLALQNILSGCWTALFPVAWSTHHRTWWRTDSITKALIPRRESHWVFVRRYHDSRRKRQHHLSKPCI